MIEYNITYCDDWDLGQENTDGSYVVKRYNNNPEPFGLDRKFPEDQKKGVKYYTYLNKRVVKNKIKPHKFILWDRKKKIIYKKVINKI